MPMGRRRSWAPASPRVARADSGTGTTEAETTTTAAVLASVVPRKPLQQRISARAGSFDELGDRGESFPESTRLAGSENPGALRASNTRRQVVNQFSIGMCTVALGAALAVTASIRADGMIGINVVLNQPPSASVLAELGTHGEVL